MFQGFASIKCGLSNFRNRFDVHAMNKSEFNKDDTVRVKTYYPDATDENSCFRHNPVLENYHGASKLSKVTSRYAGRDGVVLSVRNQSSF